MQRRPVKKPSADDEASAASALLKLAEMVGTPPAFKARLSELRQVADTERAAVAKLRADTIAELEKLKREQQEELRAQRDELAREKADFQSKLKEAVQAFKRAVSGDIPR